MELMFYIAAEGDLSDKAIAVATMGRYSHVEMRFSDGICFSSSPRDGGTRFKEIRVNHKHWDICPLPEITQEQENRIRGWCRTQEGLAYDWKAIICFFLPGDIHTPNEWYCSEICAVALSYSGHMFKFPKKISPNEMHKMVVEKTYNSSSNI